MNYQKELEGLLAALSGRPTPASLLLHSCCGPCSSYVLEYLWDKFAVTVLYYNPNIHPLEEYERRKAEQIRLIEGYRTQGRPIAFLDCDYDASAFSVCSRGLESEPEGGLRCRECFALRLAETARLAREGSFDYFGTTLTVSPHKNAALINELGMALGGEIGVSFLLSDFKKRDGYRRSIALSREYDLYRQDYCGCAHSLAARQETPSAL
ncbi:MAG: epoxyqueuosine reductase QueH [Firmicutes bacterium]|nr:epoxyqueuosine reductase QueH [Bacillota bacterium]